jgi:hypothetical protein
VIFIEMLRKHYLTLLREIKNLLPVGVAQPQTIMTDFEIAMINGILIEFQQTAHRGCFFHLCQSIFRHIQENGLKGEYEPNPEVALTLKLLPALAFVPTQDVVEGFEHLCDQNIFSPELQVIIIIIIIIIIMISDRAEAEACYARVIGIGSA